MAMPLTKRAQVLFSQEQYAFLEKEAKRSGKSIGALIREAIEKVYGERSTEARLAAAKRLVAMKLPVGSWKRMEKEIERVATQ